MGDLGKSIVAEGFEKLPKVQNITRSGHTGRERVRSRAAVAEPSFLNARDVKIP